MIPSGALLSIFDSSCRCSLIVLYYFRFKMTTILSVEIRGRAALRMGDFFPRTLRPPPGIMKSMQESHDSSQSKALEYASNLLLVLYQKEEGGKLFPGALLDLGPKAATLMTGDPLDADSSAIVHLRLADQEECRLPGTVKW